ncbi:MAG: hypothetical protein ACETWQ_22540 [Phycisphaerae bacterium]
MAKSKKKVKKTEKKVTEKKAKSEVKKDKFGSRIGSTNAKVNAILSKKAKKMGQIREEAKITSTCYEHLNKLIEQGVVVKSEDGYALK